MSAVVEITAGPRSAFGKGASRQLRRAGQVPAVIYGQGKELTHVALPAHELGLALRKTRVVLSVSYEGKSILVKPRDVQKDPVRQTIEHVDLIIITEAEAQERSDVADAIHAAEVAAAEAGIDPAAAVAAVEDAIAHGESAADAAAHAVSDVQEKADEYTEANKAEAAAEAAGSAEAGATETA